MPGINDALCRDRLATAGRQLKIGGWRTEGNSPHSRLLVFSRAHSASIYLQATGWQHPGIDNFQRDSLASVAEPSTNARRCSLARCI